MCRFKSPFALTLASTFLVLPAAAQDLAQFEKRVTERVLANGMRFLIVERHEVPVISFHLYADVGSVDEDAGRSGMAHMFEHMAFKGTPDIGTTDYTKEKEALDRVDEAFAALQAARLSHGDEDPERLHPLEEAFKKAQEEASQYVVPNEFAQVMEENGGVGLNATTAADATRYFVSFPSNKIELWFSLESARFLHPVLREFYKERDVVQEERRLRVDSQPMGKLMEDFAAIAYEAHPYQRPTIGWESDLRNLTRPAARDFFHRFYTPPNLTAVLVGDVDPEQAIRFAETYFGRIPHGPRPERVWTVEPPQDGERRFTLLSRAQPALLMGYHKPSLRHEDDAVFDAVQDVLAGGRTSRLYRSLVQDRQLAIAAGGFPGFPDDKYPNLFLFYAFAAAGHDNRENEEAMLEEIEKLKTELVTEEELERVKHRARADLVSGLDSNHGLAFQLAYYQVKTGDWRNLFRRLDVIEKVSREDIQRVAKTYFTERNRTVGYLVPDEPPSSSSSGNEE